MYMNHQWISNGCFRRRIIEKFRTCAKLSLFNIEYPPTKSSQYHICKLLWFFLSKVENCDWPAVWRSRLFSFCSRIDSTRFKWLAALRWSLMLNYLFECTILLQIKQYNSLFGVFESWSGQSYTYFWILAAWYCSVTADIFAVIKNYWKI